MRPHNPSGVNAKGEKKGNRKQNQKTVKKSEVVFSNSLFRIIFSLI